MSALPKAVQKQVDTANAILEEMHRAPETDSDGNPIAPEPTPAPEPVAGEPTPEPTPAPEPEPEKAEHKYKVLQGKYNAEVPRLQSDLKESKDLIAEMRQRLNNTESLLASMQATREPAAAPPPETPEVVVTDEEVAQFGPDLIDVIERVAARKILPEIESRLAPLDARFTTVEENASNTQEIVARSDRVKFLAALSEAVPEWETQNEEKDFLGWLNEVDPYSGVARGQLLTEASRRNDSVRAIAFFKGFQTENAAVAPEPIVTPLETPAEPQQTLESLVAPGTPKTGTTSAPDESGKRVWTRADISGFYASKNEFIRKGKKVPDSYVALEKDLFAAQSEGRIR